MVYVDFGRIPYARMLMCHMLADTEEELLEMADRIGVARKWIQRPARNPVHFDICQSKRALAVKNGAKDLRNKIVGMAQQAIYQGEGSKIEDPPTILRIETRTGRDGFEVLDSQGARAWRERKRFDHEKFREAYNLLDGV